MQSLMLVKDNKIEQIPVTTGSVIDNQWLITSGLKAGDVVVVEGFQKIRPGAPAQATPWKPDEAGKAAQPAGAEAKAADTEAKPAAAGAKSGARKSGGKGKSGSGRVELGGGR